MTYSLFTTAEWMSEESLQLSEGQCATDHQQRIVGSHLNVILKNPQNQFYILENRSLLIRALFCGEV